MTSQTAREALIEELAEAIRKTLPDFPYSTRISAAVTTLSIITRIEAEALARGRMEGAKAGLDMAAGVARDFDDGADDNPHNLAANVIADAILALDPAAIVKGLNDDDKT